jgi:hypothetical protein
MAITGRFASRLLSGGLFLQSPVPEVAGIVGSRGAHISKHVPHLFLPPSDVMDARMSVRIA